MAYAKNAARYIFCIMMIMIIINKGEEVRRHAIR